MFVPTLQPLSESLHFCGRNLVCRSFTISALSLCPDVLRFRTQKRKVCTPPLGCRDLGFLSLPTLFTCPNSRDSVPLAPVSPGRSFSTHTRTQALERTSGPESGESDSTVDRASTPGKGRGAQRTFTLSGPFPCPRKRCWHRYYRNCTPVGRPVTGVGSLST